MEESDYVCVNADIVLASASSEEETARGLLSTASKGWATSARLPQTLVFTRTGVKPVAALGITCWHDYKSNPRVIVLSAAAEGGPFITWATVRLLRKCGTQIFAFKPLPPVFVRLRLSLQENFGDEVSYITRLDFMGRADGVEADKEAPGEEALSSVRESQLDARAEARRRRIGELQRKYGLNEK